MRHFPLHLILLLGTILTLGACGERQAYREALSRAEAAMGEHPDSALLILDSLGQHEQEFGSHFRMQYLLHRTNAQSKIKVKFTSDSLTKALADHFDSNGTPNERMLAHYLLGLAYSDMGEAPQAISSFQDAIDASDTTATDCDFYTLECVYSQMAAVYHRQLLLTNEIEARKKASRFALRANQIKWAIYNQAISAGAYILLNKKDSAEIILKSALEQYRANGYVQQALHYSKTLLNLYIESPEHLDEAKALIDEFEAKSDLFDEHHELPPSQHIFYYYKGKYHEGVSQLDSAEYYYRKIYRPGMSHTSQDPMYRGLLSVFSKRHQTDSIAKYARLYCMANDSSIALKDRDIVAQITATYNYNRLQKEAHENEVKAYRRKIWLTIIAGLLVITFIAALLIWIHHQQKIKNIKTEYAEATDKHEENMRQLRMLESVHRMDYESEKARLLAENDELQKQIKDLQKEKAISKHLATSEAFAKETIVKRFREIDNNPITSVTDTEWYELTMVRLLHERSIRI